MTPENLPGLMLTAAALGPLWTPKSIATKLPERAEHPPAVSDSPSVLNGPQERLAA